MIFSSFVMDRLDTLWIKLPFIGKGFKRTFTYFSKHTTIADAIHLALGAAIPLVILGHYWWALPFLLVGVGGHIVAYSKGGS